MENCVQNRVLLWLIKKGPCGTLELKIAAGSSCGNLTFLSNKIMEINVNMFKIKLCRFSKWISQIHYLHNFVWYNTLISLLMKIWRSNRCRKLLWKSDFFMFLKNSSYENLERRIAAGEFLNVKTASSKLFCIGDAGGIESHQKWVLRKSGAKNRCRKLKWKSDFFIKHNYEN